MTRSTALSAIRPIPRRGLSRVEAAMYIGISASKFDELVRDGRLPGPKRIDGRKVWDVLATRSGLQFAFPMIMIGDKGTPLTMLGISGEPS